MMPISVFFKNIYSPLYIHNIYREDGFTIIELIIVIVIVGILAVLALPKFIDLSGDASKATIQGIAGALASANQINYIARKENAGNGVAVANCTAVASALVNATLPTGYSITSLAITAGTTSVCTVTGPSGSTATFLGTGI